MQVSPEKIELTVQWFSRLFSSGDHYRYPTTKEIEELAAIFAMSVPEAGGAIESLLKWQPLPDGTWPHLVTCSGDRRFPPGEKGHSCSCRTAHYPAPNTDEGLLLEAISAYRGPNDVLCNIRGLRAVLEMCTQYHTAKHIEQVKALLGPCDPRERGILWRGTTTCIEDFNEIVKQRLDGFLAPPEPVSAEASVTKILERSAGHAAGLLSPNLADEIVAAVRQVDRVPRSLISALATVYRSVEGEDRARIAVIACRLGVNKEVESLAQADKEGAQEAKDGTRTRT